MVLLILFLIYAVFFGLVCDSLARARGRSPEGWFTLGMLFGFLAALVLLILPERGPTCPGCKETVKIGALVCRHCAFTFPEPARMAVETNYCLNCERPLPKGATDCTACGTVRGETAPRLA